MATETGMAPPGVVRYAVSENPADVAAITVSGAITLPSIPETVAASGGPVPTVALGAIATAKEILHEELSVGRLWKVPLRSPFPSGALTVQLALSGSDSGAESVASPGSGFGMEKVPEAAPAGISMFRVGLTVLPAAT